MNRLFEPEHELSPGEVHELLGNEDVLLVDVREPYEWEAGRIPSALHIELERLASKAEDIPRDRRVVFVCRLGVRSAMAMRAFRSADWDAWHMGGGITRWAEDGLPMEPDGAVVAPH